MRLQVEFISIERKFKYFIGEKIHEMFSNIGKIQLNK